MEVIGFVAQVDLSDVSYLVSAVTRHQEDTDVVPSGLQRCHQMHRCLLGHLHLPLLGGLFYFLDDLGLLPVDPCNLPLRVKSTAAASDRVRGVDWGKLG